MPREKYVKKNKKENEKKMISTRVHVMTLNAFNNASNDAKENGYSISMTEVIEQALREAVIEYKHISGVDFLDIERQKLIKEWEKEWIKEQEEEARIFEERMMEHMAAEYDLLHEEEMDRGKSHVETQIQARLERDSQALLTMSDSEIKKYREKRLQEEKKIEEKTSELIKQAKVRFAK